MSYTWTLHTVVHALVLHIILCVGSATDGNAVLSVVCVHLARLDRLLLAGITEIIALRAQKPVWVCAVHIASRLPCYSLLCIYRAVLCQWYGGGVLDRQIGTVALPPCPALDCWSAIYIRNYSAHGLITWHIFLPAVSVTLMLPAALSRGWVSIPTPQAVQGALCQAAASVQATVTQLTSPHPLPPPSSQP